MIKSCLNPLKAIFILVYLSSMLFINQLKSQSQDLNKINKNKIVLGLDLSNKIFSPKVESFYSTDFYLPWGSSRDILKTKYILGANGKFEARSSR